VNLLIDREEAQALIEDSSPQLVRPAVLARSPRVFNWKLITTLILAGLSLLVLVAIVVFLATR
jgi:hypothetical protein